MCVTILCNQASQKETVLSRGCLARAGAELSGPPHPPAQVASENLRERDREKLLVVWMSERVVLGCRCVVMDSVASSQALWLLVLFFPLVGDFHILAGDFELLMSEGRRLEWLTPSACLFLNNWSQAILERQPLYFVILGKCV